MELPLRSEGSPIFVQSSGRGEGVRLNDRLFSLLAGDFLSGVGGSCGLNPFYTGSDRALPVQRSRAR